MIYTMSGYKNQFSIYDGCGFDDYTDKDIFSGIKEIIETDDFDDNGKPMSDELYIYEFNHYGEAIARALVKSGYTDATKITLESGKRKPYTGSFYYLLSSDLGTWYSINVLSFSGKFTQILSLDNLIAGIDEKTLADSFPTDEEAQTHRTTKSGMIAIKLMRKMGLSGTTIASCAYKYWKDGTSKYDFGVLYKDARKQDGINDGETLDDYLRKSYSGGWCYQKARDYEIYKNGITLDVNSLYPYVMVNYKLPVMKPHFFTDEKTLERVQRFTKDYQRYFYYIRFKCHFTVKPGHLPFVRVQNDISYNPHEILSTSDIYVSTHRKTVYRETELTLSMYEFELFFEQYDVKNYQFIDGVYFECTTGIFYHYVKTWWNMKAYSKQDGDKGRERIAKIMLNSLSGGMSKKGERLNQILDETYSTVTTQVKSPSHIAIGSAITSIARCIIIRCAQANYKYFLYSDTDSLHLSCTENEVQGVKIGDGLGEFKIERTWSEARFYKQKCYCEIDTDGGAHLTYAGIDKATQHRLETLFEGKIPDTPDGIDEHGWRKWCFESGLLDRTAWCTLDKIRIPVKMRAPSQNFSYRTELIFYTLELKRRDILPLLRMRGKSTRGKLSNSPVSCYS